MVKGGTTVSGAKTVLSSTLQQSFNTQERDWNKKHNQPHIHLQIGVAYYDAILADVHIRSYCLCIDNTVLPNNNIISHVHWIEGTPIK